MAASGTLFFAVVKSIWAMTNSSYVISNSVAEAAIANSVLLYIHLLTRIRIFTMVHIYVHIHVQTNIFMG